MTASLGRAGRCAPPRWRRAARGFRGGKANSACSLSEGHRQFLPVVDLSGRLRNRHDHAFALRPKRVAFADCPFTSDVPASLSTQWAECYRRASRTCWISGGTHADCGIWLSRRQRRHCWRRSAPTRLTTRHTPNLKGEWTCARRAERQSYRGVQRTILHKPARSRPGSAAADAGMVRRSSRPTWLTRSWGGRGPATLHLPVPVAAGMPRIMGSYGPDVEIAVMPETTYILTSTTSATAGASTRTGATFPPTWRTIRRSPAIRSATGSTRMPATAATTPSIVETRVASSGPRDL